jgi:antitoxin component of MazEF toxin-antitoxin module
MQTMKIRRTGNSNAVSLPKELEELGYVPGAEVMIIALPSGELRILRQDHVRELVRQAGRQVIEEDQEALRILEAYDRGTAE